MWYLNNAGVIPTQVYNMIKDSIEMLLVSNIVECHPNHPNGGSGSPCHFGQ